MSEIDRILKIDKEKYAVYFKDIEILFFNKKYSLAYSIVSDIDKNGITKDIINNVEIKIVKDIRMVARKNRIGDYIFDINKISQHLSVGDWNIELQKNELYIEKYDINLEKINYIIVSIDDGDMSEMKKRNRLQKLKRLGI